MHQGKLQQNQMRTLGQKKLLWWKKETIYPFRNHTMKMSYPKKKSITHLETHQTSSEQVNIMPHITPGEIIAITSKS